MTINKDIEAFARKSATARAGALAAQTSHDDASLMIGSVERALDDLRNGRMVLPAEAGIRRNETDGENAAPPKPTGLKRGIGTVFVSALVVVLGAIFAWPIGNSSANLGSDGPGAATNTIAEAAVNLPDDNRDALSRTNATDSIGRMYAAEFSRSDTATVRCLAEAVYYEARGEPYIGQVAVAQVVLNRARSGKWSRSLCAVIAQGVERGEKCQFSYMCRTSRVAPHGAQWDRAQEIAIDAVRGRVWLRELVEATHYHTHAVTPVWRHGLEPLGSFGSHVFYRTPELGYVLAVARAADQTSGKVGSVLVERSESVQRMDVTSATASDVLDFQLSTPARVIAPVVSTKLRPLVRQTRIAADAPPASHTAKADHDWVRDLQTR